VTGGRCAIVGGGLAGLVAYATLRHGGLEPEEISVFGTDPDPAAGWARRARAIRQRRMRSESDGHCLPTTFPGLAVREALRRRTPVPLVASLIDRYHPTVDDFLEHVAEVRDRSAWNESFRKRRVERVVGVEGGFTLDGEGPFPHVLLALGHPGLNVPAWARGDDRYVHAYEPHDYAETVEVIGAGMAAATEWLNALAAGASVVSVRRREPVRRPLNVEREYFSRRGLARYHVTGPDERVALLRHFAVPSYPPGREWDKPIVRATADGRFRVAEERNGARQVICATGFERGFQRNRLLKTLVDDHELETKADWIVLAPDSTVPRLTDETRTLALAGVAAQWAFPAADTLAGARYAAHRFLRRVLACPTR
jgi:cation diffusion facilitator CzcD-associated flavoprotein CzcO